MNTVPLIQIQPLVTAGPQPNFPALDAHLQGVGLEISRLSNLPAQVDDQNFQVLNANITAIINGVNQLIQITQNIQNRFTAFRYQ